MQFRDHEYPTETAATNARDFPPNSKAATKILDSAAIGIEFSKKVNNRAARPRKGFIASFDLSGDTTNETPLYKIMSTRKGAALRLKLYLTIILIGVGKPHSVSAPSSTYSRLFGLPDVSGPRAVNDALRWLAKSDLIKLDTAKGVPRTATLLSDLGTGGDYTLPVGTRNKAWTAESYFHVPSALWTEGWMATLNSAELAMLLVVLTELRGKTEMEIYFGPSEFKNRYGLSESLRHRGTKGLITLGLVTKRTGTARRTPLEVERKRSILAFHPKILDLDLQSV